MKENVLFTALHKCFKPLRWCHVKLNSCFCDQQTVQINHSSKSTGICGLRIQKPPAFQILRACRSSMSGVMWKKRFHGECERLTKSLREGHWAQKGHTTNKVVYFHFIKINIITFHKNNNLYKKRKLNYQIKDQTGTAQSRPSILT